LQWVTRESAERSPVNNDAMPQIHSRRSRVQRHACMDQKAPALERVAPESLTALYRRATAVGFS
jgi:hypothetical protein